MKKVYIFYHNPCIHESAAYPVSLHKTKKGAYKAMNKWLNDTFNEKYSDRLLYGKHNNDWYFTFKVGVHQSWCVRVKKVLE